MLKAHAYLGSGYSWAELDRHGYECVRELEPGKLYADRHAPGQVLLVTHLSVTQVPGPVWYFTVGQRWSPAAGIPDDVLQEADWPRLFDVLCRPTRYHHPPFPVRAPHPP